MVVKEESLRGYNPRVDFDIAIIGGGLAGASLAAALAESRLRLALIERKPPAALDPQWDSRVYALTPASIAFLDRIGAWRRLEAARVTPIYAMRVFGDDGSSRLDFSAYESGVLQLAATACSRISPCPTGASRSSGPHRKRTHAICSPLRPRRFALA